MNFDDVNYGMYNKYILIDPNKGDSNVEIKELKEREGFDDYQESQNNILDKDTVSLPLTEANLISSDHPKFQHDETDTLTEEERLQIQKDKDEEIEKEKLKKQQEEEDESPDPKISEVTS